MKPCIYPVLVFMIVLALLPACSGKPISIKENTRLTKNVLNNTIYNTFVEFAGIEQSSTPA